MKRLKGAIAIILAAAILLSATAAIAAEPILGVDVSYHNGTIDFTDMQRGGRDFAMIRLGYYNKLDKLFEQNVAAAEAAEIEYGVYLYSYAYSVSQAETEANFVVETLKSLGDTVKHFTLPVAYDLEDQKLIENCKTKEQITKQMNAFCKIIKDAGYTPMIYANRNWFLNYIDLDEVVNNGYKIWYAYWPNEIPTDFSKQPTIGDTGVKADMWQYYGADTASATSYDMNVIYDAATLITPQECEHSFDIETLVPPTETQRGYLLHTCSKCGREFKTNFSYARKCNAWNYIGGNWYFLDENGEPLTGWQQIKGEWYYFNARGIMKTGWLKFGSVWYFLKDDGAMATGRVEVSGVWYCFDENGAMVTGWQRLDGTWYYFDETGAGLTGWQQLDEVWYYFGADGAMQTGWQKINARWFYFAGSGAMQTGWQKIGGKWYHFHTSGAMQISWQKIDGAWYYFRQNGDMATGWEKVSGGWYYLNSNGTMKTGWLKWHGSWYYLDIVGRMVAGTSKNINGKTYKFNSSGVCLNP